jgi:uncharacterized membrane protein
MAKDRVGVKRAHLPEQVVDLDDADHYSDTSRIKGLSDGVFSIAMTLLAFTLIEHLPGDDVAAMTAAGFVDSFGPSLLLYGMSFVILGTYWVGHAIQFHYIVRSDRPLMVRTVIFLMFVSIVPFSTAFLARYPTDRIAIAVYCANLALAGIANLGTLLHATKDPLMLHRVMDRRIFRGVRAAFLTGPILYVIAFLVSLASATAAFVVCVAVPILTFFPNPFWGRVYARLVGNRDADGAAEPR